jgi:hypothetical protein
MHLVLTKDYCRPEFSKFEACFDAAEAGTRPEDECMPLVRSFLFRGGGGVNGSRACWLCVSRLRALLT